MTNTLVLNDLGFSIGGRQIPIRLNDQLHFPTQNPSERPGLPDASLVPLIRSGNIGLGVVKLGPRDLITAAIRTSHVHSAFRLIEETPYRVFAAVRAQSFTDTFFSFNEIYIFRHALV